MSSGGRLGAVGGTRIADGDESDQFVAAIGVLTSGVLQVAVSAGVATFSTYAATATRIPFGSGTNGGLTDSANLVYDSANVRVGIGMTPVHNLTVNDPANTFTAISLYNSNANAANRTWLLTSNFSAFGDFHIRQSTLIGGNPISAGTSCIAISAGRAVTIGGGTGTVLVDTVGRLSGTALHNNGSSPTGTTNQYVASGTYTPTLTGVTNVAASTARKCQWIRVGNVVSVSGSFDIDPTAAAATALGISLPIASNLALATDLGGTMAGDSSAAIEAGAIRGDAANDRAEVTYTAVNVANHTCSFSFQYEVL